MSSAAPPPRPPEAGAPDPPGTERASPSGRGPLVAILVIVALGALALAVLGASADRGTISSFEGDTEREWEAPENPEPFSEPDWSTQDEPTVPPGGESVRTGLVTTIIVAAVVLLVLAVWVWLRMRKLSGPPQREAGEVDGEDELSAAQARSALEDARTHLATGLDAHDAVIAAWLALERAIAEAGIRRGPSQTTLEFVLTVLGDLDLDSSDLDRLAHLYRRALFDDDPLREDAREEAIALLDRLTAQLGDRDREATTGRGQTREP